MCRRKMHVVVCVTLQVHVHNVCIHVCAECRVKETKMDSAMKGENEVHVKQMRIECERCVVRNNHV